MQALYRRGWQCWKQTIVVLDREEAGNPVVSVLKLHIYLLSRACCTQSHATVLALEIHVKCSAHHMK